MTDKQITKHFLEGNAISIKGRVYIAVDALEVKPDKAEEKATPKAKADENAAQAVVEGRSR